MSHKIVFNLIVVVVVFFSIDEMNCLPETMIVMDRIVECMKIELDYSILKI